MRTANSGAGKPKGIFTLLRISFINAAFDNGAGEVQLMKRITKLENGALKEEVFDRFSFVPMIEGKNN